MKIKMSMKKVPMKSRMDIVLPEVVPVGKAVLGIEEIPLKKAVKMGLAIPAYRVGKKFISAAPAGMGVFAKWAIQVVDENGIPVLIRHPKTNKMVKKVEGPSHSFTRNFGFWVRGFLENIDSALNLNETLTDDTGATFLIRHKGPVTSTVAGVTGLAKIKFGNSSAALSTTQTNLQGTLLGPTTEGTVTVNLIVEDSTQTQFTVVGQVTNGTGGAFTVEEMGLFPELNSSTAVTNRTTMMLRDLTGTTNVNDGQTIIGTYTFTIAV